VVILVVILLEIDTFGLVLIEVFIDIFDFLVVLFAFSVVNGISKITLLHLP